MPCVDDHQEDDVDVAKKQRQLSNIKRYEELLSHAFGTRCYLSLQHCHHNDCVPKS